MDWWWRFLRGGCNCEEDHYTSAGNGRIPLGALVANGRELDRQLLITGYEELFMKGLALQATVKKQTNVLQHMG